MVSKLGFTAAILTLSALLPLQAQVPKPSDKKPGAGAAPALRFSIYGAVAKPGSYQLKPGYRLSDALSCVAGPMPQANLTIIRITHASRPQGAPQKVWVNFDDFVMRGKPSGNPLVQADDTIYVFRNKIPPPRLVY